MSSGSTLDCGPLVSIIVPVYNSERYLPTLLDSIQSQTYRNLEIICVNDGSTDHSLRIVNAYARTDDRILVVDKSNSGAASTRNVGLEHVHGDYLCFVDSDDYIVDRAIEKLVYTALMADVDAVIFDMDNFDDRTGQTSPTNAVVKEHVPSNIVFTCSDVPNFYKRVVGFTVNKLYRSSYLKDLNLRFPLIGAHEDMPFTYLALSSAQSLFYLDETLYFYRRDREGSLSDGTNDDSRYMLAALDAFRTDLKRFGLWEKRERDFVNYALHMCNWKYSVLCRRLRWAFGGECRFGIFKQFEICDHDESYYYDKDDYAFYKHVGTPGFLYRVVTSAAFLAQRIQRLLDGSH